MNLLNSLSINMLYIENLWHWSILSILSFIGILNTTLYYTYFWQLKEYRLDRMRDFLRTKSGLRKIFSFLTLAKLFILLEVVLCFALPNTNNSILFQLLEISIGLILVGEFLSILWRIAKRKLYRPVITAKVLIIVFLTIVIDVLLGNMMYRLIRWESIWELNLAETVWLLPVILIFSYLILPIVNALVVGLLYPITQFSKGRKLAAAHRKIAKMQGLKVIGITGSYGKSSVKEFLAQMLETKFRVLKTPGNTNTEIGVAEVVLRNLKPEHEVFIVEAGAYKIGEIKKIAEMVKPRIGIITAVKDAHLGLFGSLENIKKAKFELIEALPEFGVGIFNNDNVGSADLAGKAEVQKIIRYGSGAGADLRAENLKADIDGVSFEVQGVKFRAELAGRQNISNILGAMAAAMEMGMKLEELVNIVAGLKMRDHTLTVKKVSTDLVLIDDTYNANPDGVVAGLEYLNLYSGWQKIVVFPGMLELGEKSEEEHARVATKMTEVCDLVILTSHDFDKAIRNVFEEKNYQNFTYYVDNQTGQADFLKEKIAAKKSVLLFISRGNEMVIKKLSQ
ncbi:UDP-N-acetylmuramoyl-tripeptide--D-alanyl-D-alanine ligase [Candidatus Peregrinibacteria bacterium]|nr:UDP-N-acetylmuramoyl-tripeptide--D-alanyl-D-alanine ligase [Candidatus Peregrinibacteria bacterium]